MLVLGVLGETKVFIYLFISIMCVNPKKMILNDKRSVLFSLELITVLFYIQVLLIYENILHVVFL